MNQSIVILLIVLGLFAGSAVSAQPPGLAPSPAAGPALKVPKGKWLEGERGFKEALEIQDATGADILMYFFREDIKDEKGLCTWWERHGIQNGDVAKVLQDIIKVKMKLPLRKSEEATFSRFKFNKCPAVFVLRSGNYPQKIAVFDWPNNKPKIKSAEDLIAQIKGTGGQTNAPEKK